MKKELFNELKSRTEKLEATILKLNGGKGSGNFGHSGRPGKVGGSGKGSGGLSEYEKQLKDLDKEGVPFTSPRYQAVWQEYQKAEKKAKYDIPKSILEAYETSSSKYTDPEKMEIVTTPKGNLNLMYDGKDVSTIGGDKFSESTLESLREQGILKSADEFFSKKSDTKLKKAGAQSRIDGLTKRIKALKEGMAKAKKSGDKSHAKTDEAVLKDLEKQLKQAKKDLESYK